MRITSGLLRNRRFSAPKQAVRPTMDRVRQAIFSALGGTCAGLRVLDLFAGAGSLGLEAWSRGAAAVVFVEQDPAVWKNLSENIAALQSDGLGEVHCLKTDALAFLGRAGEPFDLILADPPYDLPGALTQTLAGIAAHSVLKAGGTVVYELRSSDALELPVGWNLLRDRVYGDTRVLMLRLGENEE